MNRMMIPLAGLASVLCASALARLPVTSIDTGYTIIHVRTGILRGRSVIVGASYEGTILAVDYDGKMLWGEPNPLSGYMVRDLWCGDVDGDDNDEVLAALSDGSVHCLSLADGRPCWAKPFQPNEVPMNAVCTIRTAPAETTIACGGFDLNLYYLDKDGHPIKTMASATYSNLHPWGRDQEHLGRPIGNGHAVNFLRPIPQPDGTDHLLMLGFHNHLQASGELYEFGPLGKKPIKTRAIPYTRAVGHMTVIDPARNGNNRVLMGSSELSSQRAMEINLLTDAARFHDLRDIGPTGYRVTQTTVIPMGETWQYFLLCGDHIVLLPPDFDGEKKETLAGTYAFNDMWRDPANGRIVLGSAQSGGSCVHVLDPGVPGWKEAFQKLEPPGKIRTIKANVATAWRQVQRFTPPHWERRPIPVYLPNSDHPVALDVASKYESPVFMASYWHSGHVQETGWRNRPETYVANDEYRKRTDRRNAYDRSQQQILDRMLPKFNGQKAADFWGGHGNDPLYYEPDTLRKAMEGAEGTKLIMAWPELQDDSDDFAWVVENIFYPLADFCREHGAWLVFKNKDIFWSTSPYLPLWHRLLSGEYADVFCSSMEETTDKTQDLSLAGRLGLWAAGSMNQWGMRTSRDNPSFDRSRQFSYQRLPNHFLRTTVWNLACGATYCGLTTIDDEHFRILWPLLAKGALFVPRREEIVSFSPVHLSMVNPDERYMREGKNKKWTIFYDGETESANPMVFSRMNGSWPAAALSDWDFSRYASGLRDRRQNFLPPFPHGIVLITPVQNGPLTGLRAPRGKLRDHLHPLYRDILQEVITDGRDYVDRDGKTRYRADSYYTTVAQAIAGSAARLPLTVPGGNVAWVCAQTAPSHLRLTLVDSGYLNPSDRTAKVVFHTVAPVKITDLLSGGSYSPVGDTVDIDVPLGLFRFIDIEIEQELPR